MEELRRLYGDRFILHVGWMFGSVILASDPEAIQQIFTSSKFRSTGQATRQFTGPFLGTRSVVSARGERHRRKRKLLLPPFHRERLQTYPQRIRELSDRAIRQQIPGIGFSIRPLAQSITLQVIMDVVLGECANGRDRVLREHLKNWSEAIASPIVTSSILFEPLRDLPDWTPWGQFRHLSETIDELLYAEIRHRRSHLDPHRPDILTLLLQARDENGDPLEDDEIRDELMTLLISGQETAATAIAWAMYWIHRNPSVRDRLIAELDGLGPDPDPLEMMKLPYLDAVCSETLRFYPPTPLTSQFEATEPVEFGDCLLQPGTRVSICIYLVHHREDLYPEPKQFKPERFLDRKFSQYEYLPFGGGSRRCIGEALATMEIKMVVGTLLSRYRLEMLTQMPVQPRFRGFVLLAPDRDIRFVCLGRR